LAQPAGGAVDLVARALADRLTEILDHPIVVDNQPGSNGGVAGRLVVNHPPGRKSAAD
jgi:tripartite-type tricarboxylate transporter receptor subunit TctC